MDSLEQRLNRTLALAGVVQAAYLVKQLASKGNIHSDDLGTSIHSIFATDPESVTDVYGKNRNLIMGLQGVINLFSESKTPKDQDIARYAISLLHLERLFNKKPAMIKLVQRGVERAKTQAHHFSPTHENVIANLASVYTDTLSTFRFRIHVTGDSTYLSSNNTINKVRALLLAGVRSAVLWRQLGGSRWQIVFGKKTLIEDAKYILARVNSLEAETVD